MMLNKHVMIAFGAACLMTGAANAQDGATTRDGIEPTGQEVTAAAQPDVSSEQIRLDQMAMQQVMNSQERMTAAKENLMSDDDVAERVAREILMQEMVRDNKYLKMMRDGLRSDTDNEPKMKVLVDKISKAKAKLMKDEDALMSLTQELMVRQIAANRIAMMNGGRFQKETTGTKDSENVTSQELQNSRSNDIDADQPTGASDPTGSK